MTRHPEMTALAIQFFARFSRLEHALKLAGFCKQNRSNRGIEILWDEFANETGVGGLFEQLQDNPDVAYIINEPPQKRVLEGKQLAWRRVDPARSMSDLCASLRRTRNNLFHGDKANPALSRNERLFKACLVIIDAMLDACPRVQQEYEFAVELA